MKDRRHRILVSASALLAIGVLRCGNDGAGNRNADASGASIGDDSASGSGSGSMGGADGGGGNGADAWTAPDVGAPVDAGSPGTVDVTFEVHAEKSAHSISPYVYGVNNVSRAAAHHSPIARMGGNRLTAYNWENNASNAGSDYLFENDDFLCNTAKAPFACTPDSNAPGALIKAFVDQAKAAGAAALVTVPIVDYVSADKSPAGDVRSSGPNYLQTRFKQNGVKGTGVQNPPNTTDSFVYQDEMVNWLAQTEGGATIRFQLDNEPDLWSSTHAEVHPAKVTYAELAQRNIKYAKAIKAVVPNADVWGPVNYGWTGYVNLQGAPDAATNGDFVSWWLDQMSAAAKAWGKSVVDGLDLHWYSEAGNAGSGGPPGSDCRVTSDPSTNKSMPADCYTPQGAAGAAAAREQAPRSLWDPAYVENSWIAQSLGNKAIALLPLMQQKIKQHAPGMRLSISEYNYGGGSDISGTIATADALGLFGLTGIDMAMLWEVWHDESFTYAAFDAFRNYDGQGAAFGDMSIGASTTDTANSSVYASVASSDPSRLVIVAINKALSSKVTGIRVFHSTVYTKASIYTITQGGGAKVVAGAAMTSVATNAFRYTMPAQSVTVIVPAP